MSARSRRRRGTYGGRRRGVARSQARGERRPLTARRAVLGALAAVFVTASVVYGARALSVEIPVAFRNAPRNALPAPFQAQVETVLRALPPGAAVLHVSTVSESWYSRMWERALYPRHAVVYAFAQELDAARLLRIREQSGVRFAISVGTSSPGNGYRWKVPLGALPGLTEESWFGELTP